MIRIGFDIMGFIDTYTPEYKVELIGVSIYQGDTDTDTATCNIEKFAIGDGPLPTKDEILNKYRQLVIDDPLNTGRTEEIKRRLVRTALSQQAPSVSRWRGR